MARRVGPRTALLAVAAAALVACSGDDDTAESATSTGPVADEQVVLEDDFSDPASGFTVSASESGSLAYSDGAYVITAVGANSLKVSDTDFDGEAFVDSIGDVGDVRVEVDLAKAVEEGPVLMGVFCRLRIDNPSYYGALVDADGYWRLTRFAGTPVVLAEAAPDALPPVLADAGGDRLRLDCVDGPEGTTLTLSVDGEPVASVADPSPLPAGRVGMAAGTRGETVRAVATFDDLTVTTLR